MTATPDNAELNLSSKDKEFINAKSYLLTCSGDTGENLYDHLSCVISKVLDERPQNAVDIIEDISKDIKRSKFKSNVDTVQDKIDKSTEVALAEIHRKLFSKGEGEEGQDAEDDDVETPLTNLMESFFYFEQGDIGLCREELMRIWLALKDLVDRYPLQHVHFWGKILGIEQNYIVAAVEMRDGVDEEDGEEEDADENAEEETEKDDEDGEEEEHPEDDIPKSDWKPAPEIPKEENRSGTNKKTFFVCNDPGKPWVKLPPVTPAQIVVARQIKKFFTGRLDAPIVSYPPFPGNEANYLRAQIARISAGTHISPLTYYQFDEEEEEEEEDGGMKENFIINQDYECPSLRDLTDPTCSHWVHHVQHILPQGRCVWFRPPKPELDNFEDEDEEEGQEEADEETPETGPTLLTPLSEDDDLGNTSPWTAFVSYGLIQQYACAVIRSNLWPGAYAFASDKKFENVYIGFGHKYNQDNYNPPETPAIQMEFPSGEEITECQDPTVEEERQLQQAQEQAEAEEEVEEEAEEEDD